MKFGPFAAAAILVAPALALAQSPPVDPRIAPQMLTAAQAGVELRDAIIKALAEDFKKREREWAEYSKPLWATPDAK